MNTQAKFITKSAVVAAMYVVLTYLSALFGLDSGVIQIRFSEFLCILPVFMPQAIIGVTLGCMLSNLLVGGVIYDIIFGSLATLVGALGAWLLRRLPHKLIWLATLPTILANAIIIPFVLIYAYGVPDGYIYCFVTVGIGEIISAGIGGSALYYYLAKTKLINKLM